MAHLVSPTQRLTLLWLAEQALWQLQDLARLAHSTETLSTGDHMLLHDHCKTIGQLLKTIKDEHRRTI